MPPSTVLWLTLYLFAAHEHPVPHPLPGDALPDGAIARLGPDAFRYAGYAGGVAYSPDGKRLAVTSSAGITVWDAATGKRLVWVPPGDRSVVALLGFTTAGEVVVSCRRRGDDANAGAFRLEPTSGKLTASFQPVEGRWFAAASPDGKVVYSRTQVNAYRDQTVANEIDTGKELWRRPHPEMSWMRVSPDGSRLVTWSSRVQLAMDVLDAATGKTVERFVHPDGDSFSGRIAVGPKAERVVVAHSRSGGLSFFETGSEKPVVRAVLPWCDNVLLTPDGKTAVVGRGRTGIALDVWDAVVKNIKSSVSCRVGSTFALSPDGGTVVAAAYYNHPGQTLRFYDVATGKPRPFSPESFPQAAVVWYLPDGTLASVDEKLEKPVKWDAKAGVMTPLPAGSKPPPAPKPGPDFKPPEGTDRIVVSPDGKRVLGYRFDPEELDSSPGDTYLGLFDARGRVLVRYPRPDHTDGANWAFAPDGKAFAVARGDGTITFFESEAGKELRTVRHAGPVSSMAYSPDGRFLATACGDGPILVWDARGK